MEAVESVNVVVDEIVVKKKLSTRLVVPFASQEEATVAFNSLRVDREPLRGNVLKTFAVQGTALIVEFEGEQAKHLRVSVNTLIDLLVLVVRTIDRFQVPAT